jgi:Protein of unknown function (DUF2934)
MEKSGSFSQKTRITRVQTGAETANRTDFNADLRQQDDHYHAEKLGLRGHGSHEGWIKAEEAGVASNAAISAEARHKMIAVAAFYIAEKRGFAGHGAYEDWMKAEAEIDAKLHGRI